MSDRGPDLRDRLRRGRSYSRQRSLTPRERSTSVRGGDSGRRSRSRSRRSRDDRRRRDRSRSRSGISRSPSRNLYEEDRRVEDIAGLVKEQQDFLLELLTEHKAEVDTKLQSKQRRFSSKQIEKQHKINSNFLKLASNVKSALVNKDDKRALITVEDLIGQLESHAEDLIIADISPHGWLAVAKVRAGTDLPRALRKKLEQVDRDLAAQKHRHGGPGRKLFGIQKEGQGPLIRREGRRISPEDIQKYFRWLLAIS